MADMISGEAPVAGDVEVPPPPTPSENDSPARRARHAISKERMVTSPTLKDDYEQHKHEVVHQAGQGPSDVPFTCEICNMQVVGIVPRRGSPRCSKCRYNEQALKTQAIAGNYLGTITRLAVSDPPAYKSMVLTFGQECPGQHGRTRRKFDHIAFLETHTKGKRAESRGRGQFMDMLQYLNYYTTRADSQKLTPQAALSRWNKESKAPDTVKDKVIILKKFWESAVLGRYAASVLWSWA